MNQKTNNELQKIVELLQENEVYEINSDELYFLFSESKLISKSLQNKISKRSFPSIMKRYCRMKNYEYEIINVQPVLSRFYFYIN